MEKHPFAGKPVVITNGPHKGKYFMVIDFIQNQFQGKSIEKIAKSHGKLVRPVVQRMGGLDDKIVFGKLHPTMEFCCMHDTELQVVAAEAAPPAPEPIPDNVVEITKGKKNDSGRTSKRNSKNTKPGDTKQS